MLAQKHGTKEQTWIKDETTHTERMSLMVKMTDFFELYSHPVTSRGKYSFIIIVAKNVGKIPVVTGTKPVIRPIHLI